LQLTLGDYVKAFRNLAANRFQQGIANHKVREASAGGPKRNGAADYCEREPARKHSADGSMTAKVNNMMWSSQGLARV
jgi:hypothetical protein